MIRHGTYDMIDFDLSKSKTTKQAYFLKKCSDLAHHSNLTHKHGCIIVKKNQIVSSGYNFKLNSSCVHEKSDECFLTQNERDRGNNNYSVHAEVSTLKKVKNVDLSKCDMYVVRIGAYSSQNKGAGFKYSHPCDSCSRLIAAFGIRRVYYSINDLSTISEPSAPPPPPSDRLGKKTL